MWLLAIGETNWRIRIRELVVEELVGRNWWTPTQVINWWQLVDTHPSDDDAMLTGAPDHRSASYRQSSGAA